MIAELPRLHAVTDDRVIAGGGVVARAAAMADAAGPALAVHLRTRTLAAPAMLDLARELGRVLAPHGSWLVVNGRADVARASQARAVVSGRGGLSAADVRRVAPAALVMRSVHDDADLGVAAAESADALIAGSVFPTPTHPDRAPAGTALVRSAASAGKPVVAIGGITAANAAEVLRAGAWGVAAVRALWDAPSAGDAAREFLALLPREESVGVVINGERRRARSGASLAGLLADLGLDARAVVVEHNRHIVRQGALDQTRVAEGDAIELVHFVGGG